MVCAPLDWPHAKHKTNEMAQSEVVFNAVNFISYWSLTLLHYAAAPALRQRSTSYHANFTERLLDRRPPAVAGVSIDDSQSGGEPVHYQLAGPRRSPSFNPQLLLRVPQQRQLGDLRDRYLATEICLSLGLIQHQTQAALGNRAVEIEHSY